MAGEQRLQTNFGGNQTWRSRCYQPRAAGEVMRLLEEHARGHVRCFGAKHSWSDAAACEDVSLDLSLIDQVETLEGNRVRVGAGCTLQSLLDQIRAKGVTLPTVGVIKRQSVAGAISTATHGSGSQSLSHFVEEVTLAAYDAQGRPKLDTYSGGDEMKASRCALGCMGVLLSVVLRTVPNYRVQERVRLYTSLGEVLSQYAADPLTQFTFTPYRWDFLAFQRKPLEGVRLSPWQRLVAAIFRLYMVVAVDILVHATVWIAIRIGDRAVKLALRIAPFAFRPIRRTDEAEHILTQGHDRFRHEEMELFVPQSRLSEAIEILRCATEQFAGEPVAVPERLRAKLADFHAELIAQRGAYTHHYAFFFRRVLPENNTLIAMTAAAGEPYFSIGVFTYFPPEQRAGYYAFCGWLARCMYALLEARLHWGKHFPLKATDMAARYPELGRFRKLCAAADPRGVFRNAYTVRVLGFAQDAATREER